MHAIGTGESAGAERRSAPRIPTDTLVRIEFGQFKGFVDECCRNLSVGGMFVESSAPPPVGASVRFELTLPDPPTTLVAGSGEVAWVLGPGGRRSPGFGIRFQEIDALSRELIFRTVDRFIQRGGNPFNLEG